MKDLPYPVSDEKADDAQSVIVRPGKNCWRVEQATKAAVIVDAEDYFNAARAAMLGAKHRIMLIGWDFDARIRLGSESGQEGPEKLGDFISWLVERQPGLDIYLLRWDIGALRTLFRGTTIFTLLKWMAHKRIHTLLDSAHPLGSSHHQKIVVIDDCLAFCGGIDMTGDRWDSREHRHDDVRRKKPNSKPYGPWHDAITALEGPIASALGELTRERWRRAGGGKLKPVEGATDCWPVKLPCHFTDVDVAISRSNPSMPDVPTVREVEEMFLGLIAGARRHIYAESQYFASRRIAEAIGRRLAESDGPEIVVINPFTSNGWLEPIAMDTARARLYEALRRLDRHHRLRLYHPYTDGGEPIYVHAKILIVDDRVLHLGSSNMNNRSLRLDTECDVTIDAGRPGNGGAGAVIRTIRDGLIAEHLGADPAEVTLRIEASGSIVATIEAMRGEGRSLRPYEVPDLGDVERWLADNEVLDPEGPDEMFEGFTKGGLFRHLR